MFNGADGDLGDQQSTSGVVALCTTQNPVKSDVDITLNQVCMRLLKQSMDHLTFSGNLFESTANIEAVLLLMLESTEELVFAGVPEPLAISLVDQTWESRVTDFLKGTAHYMYTLHRDGRQRVKVTLESNFSLCHPNDCSFQELLTSIYLLYDRSKTVRSNRLTELNDHPDSHLTYKGDQEFAKYLKDLHFKVYTYVTFVTSKLGTFQQLGICTAWWPLECEKQELLYVTSYTALFNSLPLSFFY